MVNIALGFISHYASDILSKDLESLLKFFESFVKSNIDIEKILDVTMRLQIKTIVIEEENPTIPDEWDQEKPIKTCWNSFEF